jgi:hypothetical protein
VLSGVEGCEVGEFMCCRGAEHDSGGSLAVDSGEDVLDAVGDTGVSSVRLSKCGRFGGMERTLRSVCVGCTGFWAFLLVCWVTQ